MAAPGTVLFQDSKWSCPSPTEKKEPNHCSHLSPLHWALHGSYPENEPQRTLTYTTGPSLNYLQQPTWFFSIAHFQADPSVAAVADLCASPQSRRGECAAGVSNEGRSGHHVFVHVRKGVSPSVPRIGPFYHFALRETFLADLISCVPSAQRLKDTPNGASWNPRFIG